MGIRLPIHYVVRNANLILIAEQDSSPPLQELLRLQYINNMAKRQENAEANSLDKQFEIDTDTFVLVTNFNGHRLVHTRKYNGE